MIGNTSLNRFEKNRNEPERREEFIMNAGNQQGEERAGAC